MPAVIRDFSAAKSSGECWARKDWRRGRNWDPRSLNLQASTCLGGRNLVSNSQPENAITFVRLDGCHPGAQEALSLSHSRVV